jgi:hypothetical protein
MDPPTPTLDDPAGQPASVDWIDTAIQWASGLAAVAMFAYGVALSYAVLHAVAAAADLPGWAARLWPLGFEAFMASAALNALAEQRHRRHLGGWQRVPWYPWTLTGLTAGGSILLNWFHPAIPLDPPPGWLVSLVYGLPPLIAVFAWHLFLQRVAHRGHPTLAGTVPRPADPQQDQDWNREAGTAAVRLTSPPPVPTARSIPATTGVPAYPPPRAAAGRGGPEPEPTPQPAGRVDVLQAGLLAQAQAAAAEHQRTHGRPISRDALRQALRVSNRTAGMLLRELRADPADSDRPSQDRPTGTTHIGNHVGAAADGEPSGGTAPAAVAGNGAGSSSAGLAALVPPVPVPAQDRQVGTGDA